MMWRFEQERIHIEELRVECIVGVRPEERTHEQSLLVSLSFPADFSRASESEDLHATVDYGQVAQEVRSFLVAGEFFLLETLARGLALHLCETFTLPGLSLYVRKPGAIPDSAGPAVSLTLTRGEGDPP